MFDCIRKKHQDFPIQTIEERVAAARAICTDAIDVHAPPTPVKETHEDSRGFTYHTVRFCDLNLIRDK
jgi:hypothetical protein